MLTPPPTDVLFDAFGGEFALRLALPNELAELERIDAEAGQIFAQAGISFDLPADCAFVVAERRRWRLALERALVWVAMAPDATLLGFAVLGQVDGEPYLDQLAVRPHAMRRGIGRALLQLSQRQAGLQALWLTTYAHVPWNEPYYLRFGFERVAEESWGPDLQRVVAEQRAALPRPEQRVVLRRTAATRV